MKVGLDLDVREWEDFQKRVNGAELDKVLQDTLRQVGNQLKREAYKNFRSLKTKHPSRYHRKGKGWRKQKGSIGDSLYTKGGANSKLRLVKVRVLRKAKVPTISVNLYDNYKGIFFELGTQDRLGQRSGKIKAGATRSGYRGRIKSGSYLGRAVAGFDGKTAKALDQALAKSIEKWAKKH